MAYTSQDENRLLEHLRQAGLDPERNHLMVPNLISPELEDWPINPDLIVGDIAIEVDSPSSLGGGPSHHPDAFPAEDLYRDDCLRAVGYRIVRVRLAGLPPVPEAYNVLRDGPMTKPVMDAVVQAVRELSSGSPSRDVTVAGPKRAAARERTLLGAIIEDRYAPGALTFTWGLDERKVRFFLGGAGQFLFVSKHDTEGPTDPRVTWSNVFVRRVDLDLSDRDALRDQLAEIMPTINLATPPGAMWSATPLDDFPREANVYCARKNDPTDIIATWRLDGLPQAASAIHSDDHLKLLNAEGEVVASVGTGERLGEMGYVLGGVDLKPRRSDTILKTEFHFSR